MKRTLGQKLLQRALVAARRLALAIALSHLDQQSVKLIEQGLVRREIFVEELLDGGVIRGGRHELVTGHYPASVGVGDEEGVPSGIEQDGVYGLRSQPLQA